MSSFLKQSTAAQARAMGPFLDDVDFKTAETGLTIANTDIKLVVNGGASANKNSGGGTHRVNGMYGVTFDATDTATVGEMEVSVVVAGALPVFKTFIVVEEAIYDQLFAASALGYIANAPVNVAQISGDSTAADNLETAYDDTAGAVPWAGIVDQGTAQSVSATEIVLRAAAAFVDDALNGATVVITNGTQAGERAIIADYVGATDTATVTWPGATPSGTPTYKIFGSGAGAALTDIAAAILTAAAANPIDANVKEISDDATAADRLETMLDGTGGQSLTATFVGNISGNLSGTVASVTGAVGSVTGAIGSVSAGGINASSLAADTITASKLSADAGVEIATAVLAAATANPIDCNVQEVNDVVLQGNGTALNKWRPV